MARKSRNRTVNKAPTSKDAAAPSLPIGPIAVTELDAPPPDWLAERAREEVDRGLLDDYMETIRVLRDDKRFSFREIAEWLSGYRIEVDHNSVYRAYCKHLSDDEATQLAIDEAERERENAE
jgi:hypothetical protein